MAEYKDRVKDQTNTTGTGTVTIDGVAGAGYRTITSAHTTGATVRYTIVNSTGSEWETGQGVWTAAGATLTRATVYASSNAGGLVNFSAGAKVVFTGPVAADFNDLGPSATVTFDKVITNNNGNGTNVKIGDDVWLGDVNTANTLAVRGAQDATAGYIAFGSDTSTTLGRTGTGTLTWGGSFTIGSNPASNTSALNVGGYNQVGGVGYHGFLAITNTYGSATNPSKWFRLNSTGGIEIINNAYTATILSLSDAGALNTTGAITQAGNQVLHAANYNSYAPTLTGTGASGSWGISITGSAATLTTGRTIALTGDVTYTSGSFNGSANVTGAATLANSGVTAGTYTKVTVDAKGRVTVGASLASADLPTYTGTITSSQITTGLGFTPYNATNPSGYITSSALAPYMLAYNGASTASYDTLTTNGVWRNQGGTNGPAGTTHTTLITALQNDGNYGYQLSSTGTALYVRDKSSVWASWRTLIDSGNYNSYSPTLTGTGASGSWGISVTGSAGSVAWSGVTGKPTTLSGYGITDAASSSSLSNYLPLSGGTLTGGLQVGYGGGDLTIRATALNDLGDIVWANYAGTEVHRLWDGSSGLQYRKDGGTGYLLVHAGNFSSYSPSLSGSYANPSWITSLDASKLTGTLDNARVNGGTYTINVTGNAGSATNASAAVYVSSQDIRTLSPSSTGSARLGFGFTSWANNNTASWADYLALRSYTDASGGGDNLLMFNKSSVAMRLWQQSWGSSTAYSTYADVLMSNNYNNYSPSLTGSGASGTWGINVTGTSRLLSNPDGPRNLSDRNPNWNARTTIYDFVNASAVGTGGNFAGVMTFVPWEGTTASTGDASYQLVFGSTAANGGGNPQLRLRKGIDTTWYSWIDILTSANYNSYALPLSGGTMTGTLGLAGTATNGFYAGTGDGADYTTHNFRLHGWNGMGFYNPTTGGAYPNAVSGYVDFRNGIIDMKGGFKVNGNTVLHAGNYSSYALPLSGGQLSGDLQLLGNYLRFDQSGTRSWNMRATGGNLDLNSGDGFGSFRYNGYALLHAGNYTSYSPSLGGSGASGTWGINISGSLTASAPQLAAATESNSIYITAPSYTTDTPVKLLNFDWYGNVWSLGNIRSGATPSNGFGVYYTASGGSRTEVARWDTSRNFINQQNVTAYSDERLKTDWLQVSADFVERLAVIKSGTYTRTDSNERQAGNSAQDWQALLPEVVIEGADGILSLAYGNAALVSAVELAKRVVDQDRRLVEQDKRIAQLESLIHKLIGE